MRSTGFAQGIASFKEHASLPAGLQEETGLDSTLCTYRIEVQTSDFRGAGTTASAAATIYGPGGEAGGPPGGTAPHLSCLLQDQQPFWPARGLPESLQRHSVRAMS